LINNPPHRIQHHDTICICGQHLSIWPPTHDYLGAFRRDLSAHLRQHPTAADLLLSLLSMAKPHHPSVRFPLPRFFYRGLPGRDAVDQPALLAALSAVPPLASLVLQEGESGSGDKGAPPPFLPFAVRRVASGGQDVVDWSKTD
jgi:hypothetical protein